MSVPERSVGVAIVGPGNIGTDLLVKLRRTPGLDVRLVAGVDPASAGLARAAETGIETSVRGIEDVLERADVEIVFDATAARAHEAIAPALRAAGKRAIDLTPAAVGPYVVPLVNLEEHLDAPNVNMISCGGQATIPFVHAIDRVADVEYAEIVATISSLSAGVGTRQSIDHFTETTSRALEVVGGAVRAKAIILLNPADPPIMMRDTIFARVREPDEGRVQAAVAAMADRVREYVPGCEVRLCEVDGNRVTVMLEIRGAGDFLPAYAGNLDIMTAAAARVGQRMAEHLLTTGGAAR
jgi:acetaldehyde dehydrogenase